MTCRLRQVVLVAETLEPTVSMFRELFRAGTGDVDPAMSGFGLAHEVLRVGCDTYVEICAPLRPDGDTAADRFLRRGGAGGYMAVVQVPDAGALRARLTARGLSMPFARTHHGNALTQLHPREFGTLLEADEIRTGADWHYPALEGTTSTETTTGIVAIEVAVAEPPAMAARWAELFEIGVSDASSAVELPDGGVVRFVAHAGGRGGVVAVDVAAAEPGIAGMHRELGSVTVRFV